MTPEDILPTYDSVASDFARSRDKSLFERRWLDRMLAHTPPPRRILDLGCGSGNPIARYLTDRRARVTGVDGAPAMVALFCQTLPGARALHCDMRALDLGETFDGIIGWNSFFHLTEAEQRACIPRLADHLKTGGTCMLTVGPHAGETTGTVAGETVFHASLSPAQYATTLEECGLRLTGFLAEDPEANRHTVLMARKDGG